jgi:hypothetical protein
VSIQRVGSYGSFARRELQLPPGKYTAVGTRSGYRDVRREFVVKPGAADLAIDVRCDEPI